MLDYPTVPFSSEVWRGREVSFPISMIFLHGVCFAPKPSELSAVIASSGRCVGHVWGCGDVCTYI